MIDPTVALVICGILGAITFVAGCISSIDWDYCDADLNRRRIAKQRTIAIWIVSAILGAPILLRIWIAAVFA